MKVMITANPEIMTAIRKHNKESPETEINVSGVCRNALKRAHDKVIKGIE